MDKGKISNRYVDWISFVDDDGQTKTMFVKILEISTFVRFETEAGNTISIPSFKVNKIKQKNQSQGVVA